MNNFLQKLLPQTTENGRLEITNAVGAIHRFGDGRGALIRVRLASALAERAWFLDPEMKLG